MLFFITLYLTISMVAGEGQKTGSSESVGCFTCHSFNGSDPGCKDPFNPGYSTYTPKCKQGMEDRVGMFPAHYCIKMDGVGIHSGIGLTVRTCSLKSMHHQCGIFEFDGQPYRGCVTTCDKNGCNHGNHVIPPTSWLRTASITCIGIITMATLVRRDTLLSPAR